MRLRKIFIHIDIENEKLWINGITEDNKFIKELKKGIHFCLKNVKIKRIGVCPIDCNIRGLIDISIEFEEPITLDEIIVSKNITEAWKTLN